LLGSEWARQMSLAENALAAGKRLVLVAQGGRADFQLQRFALGSYLLITNGNASFRYANADSYLQAWVYPNYDLKLGTPLGARYLDGVAWRRDFSNGYVRVNPLNGQAVIAVNP
ncbi:MAG: putative glycoside hydrolase, partial [Anaerolineales bacterium]